MMTEELVAGREMDALVAEKVMGWNYDQEGHMWVAPNCDWAMETEPYSTDIAAAWTVVNRLNDLGLYVSIDQAQDGKAAVSVLEHALDGTEEIDRLVGGIVGADTAPLAICRAALAAVGH